VFVCEHGSLANWTDLQKSVLVLQTLKPRTWTVRSDLVFKKKKTRNNVIVRYAQERTKMLLFGFLLEMYMSARNWTGDNIIPWRQTGDKQI
jgi:hypothetical protein